MMSVLVDTSVWIEYLRNGNYSDQIEFLIDENLIVTNELILSELIPFLQVRNRRKLVSLLNTLKKIHIRINWEKIIAYQYKCLKNGINGIGIPDLIIVQNSIQNNASIYSLDSHFILMKDLFKLELFDE
ncbi:MAG: PIN domain-containing protein [Desulfocapsaceae bacterium]|jgi:predicted nucleic acid-binding protein|nr:PIN domain-containing protein [Desulfocapsaceae bacterium]